MSEILFGQSYYLRFDPKLWAAMQPYPPLGTLYAASYLRERGHDVALFDAMLAESENEWIRALDRERPRFAVLYEDNFNYLSKMCLLRMREAAFRMIEMARARNCTVVVAGSDVSDRADRYLARGAHFALIGEGEHTLGELVDRLAGRSDAPLETIRSLAFLDSDGQVVQTPRRPDVKDLDSLPFPAWDLVDVPRYQDAWRRRHGYYSMNLATSRGCPFHCNWCAKPIWGQRYNVRGPENVVAEMKWLNATYHPDHLWYVDDIMGLKPGWIQRFAELVECEGIRTPFKSLHRADLLLAGDTVDSLRRAGAKTVWVGAESGSQKILDAMDKGTRVEQIYEAARRLHAAGIEVGFFLQFGYPNETREDVEDTLRMVRECRPDDIGMSVSYPLPGTQFHEKVKQQLGEKQNWIDSEDLDVLYQGPFSTAFYRQLHLVLHKEFRARKGWDAARLAIRRQTNRTEGGGMRPPDPGSRCTDSPLDRRCRGRWQPRSTTPLPSPSRAGGSNAWPGRPNRAGEETMSSVDSRLADTQQAFDSVAAAYDGPLGNNRLIQRMRRALWRTVEETFQPGARLLDLGCGTGLDAAHFAASGYRIVATDWSPRMVERTRRRIDESGLSSLVTVRTVGIHELDRLADARFDGIYSDLGPLNCVPDLPAVARACARLLVPGGRFVASVIGRRCPWEVLYYTLHRDIERARLRAALGSVPVTLNGHVVWTRYFTPTEFSRAFAGQFELNHYRGLGLFAPPPYLVRAYERYRPLLAPLGWLDDHLGALPRFRDAGDHFLIVMTRRGDDEVTC